MKIQIFGSGCPKCNQTGQVMKDTAKTLGLQEGVDYEFEKVTDITEMQKQRILFTPAIAINGKVVLTGKVPSTADAMKLINNALNEESK